MLEGSRARRGTKTCMWFRTKIVPDMRVLEVTPMAMESRDTVLLRAVLTRTALIPREVPIVLSIFTFEFLDPE